MPAIPQFWHYWVRYLIVIFRVHLLCPKLRITSSTEIFFCHKTSVYPSKFSLWSLKISEWEVSCTRSSLFLVFSVAHCSCLPFKMEWSPLRQLLDTNFRSPCIIFNWPTDLLKIWWLSAVSIVIVRLQCTYGVTSLTNPTSRVCLRDATDASYMYSTELYRKKLGTMWMGCYVVQSTVP